MIVSVRNVVFALASAALVALACAATARAEGEYRPKFVQIPMQFIAALGDPGASAGTGAEAWGIWRKDPGPRGVPLKHFESFAANGGKAPSGWSFDGAEWWLEENGRIMEPPTFPLPAGHYIVTGGRETATVLTVHPPGEDGSARWTLDDGATLHDVTHLGCRSAVYTPGASGGVCTPADAPQSAFRVAPGAAMPPVPGCAKQDYHVLLVVGIGVADGSVLLP